MYVHCMWLDGYCMTKLPVLMYIYVCMLGPLKVSWLMRCPRFRGSFVHYNIAGTHNRVLIKEVSLFQGCPYRGVLLYFRNICMFPWNSAHSSLMLGSISWRDTESEQHRRSHTGVHQAGWTGTNAEAAGHHTAGCWDLLRCRQHCNCWHVQEHTGRPVEVFDVYM